MERLGNSQIQRNKEYYGLLENRLKPNGVFRDIDIDTYVQLSILNPLFCIVRKIKKECVETTPCCA